MIPASRLIEEARALVGVPWRHQGRTRKGVDCIGLVLVAAQNAGLDLAKAARVKAPRTYSRNPDPKLYELVQQCCEKSETLAPGYLLFFKFDADKYARHFGIYTDTGTVIHAESVTRRKVIEHGYRAHWKRWTHSVWRLPGVSYE